MGVISRLRARQAKNKEQRSSEKAASKDDIKRLRREFEKTQDGESKQTTVQTMGRTVKMFAKGFGDVGKSLATPSSSQWPKISQMPARRRDMGIVKGINLDKMKNPGLRGRDISGRRSR